MAVKIAFCLASHPGGFGDCTEPAGHVAHCNTPHRDNQPGRNAWNDDDATKIIAARLAFRADTILRRIPTAI